MRVLLVEGKARRGRRRKFRQLSPGGPHACTRSADQDAQQLHHRANQRLELGNRALSEYSAVVLADVGQLTGPEADRLKQYVEQGGTLLMFMGDSIDKNNYNSILLPRKLMPGPLVKLVAAGNDQKSFRFNFKPNAVQNEYLESFRGVENSGLDLVSVRTYWQLELPPNSDGDSHPEIRPHRSRCRQALRMRRAIPR